MIQILQFAPVPAGPQAAAAPAAGDANDPAVMDFSQLLGAGIDRLADTGVPGLPADMLQTTDPAPAATDSNGDAAAILDAIAAAQLPVDAQPAANVPLPPGLAPQASNAPASAASTANAGAVDEALAKSARPGQRNIGATDDGRGPPQAARTEAASGKLEIPVAARQAAAPGHGAFGELRAEAAATPIPESQSATHLLLAHPSRPAAQPFAARIEQLPQQLGTPAWTEGFSDRVVWMAKNDIQTAELRLNPAELGPIDVTLTLSGDDKAQATVQFSAAHATTREAIETALPRLREMMQESGITLGQAGVDANTSQAPDGDRHQQGGSHPARLAMQSETATGTAALPAGTRSQGRGLVDTFA